jgi:hypothetical protein
LRIGLLLGRFPNESEPASRGVPAITRSDPAALAILVAERAHHDPLTEAKRHA